MSGNPTDETLRVEALSVGPLACGCYVVWTEGAAEAAVIDPGGEAGRIEAVLAREGLACGWILNTHGHGDHIGANAELQARWPEAKIAVHALDAPMLTSPFKNLSLVFGVSIRSPEPDVLLAGGDTVECGALRLEVVHTPGHTPGGVTFLARTRPVHAFTGDLIMAGGVGRTDLVGSDTDALLASIRERILTLPDETVLHPGHGPETTVGRERRTNPFIQDAAAGG